MSFDAVSALKEEIDRLRTRTHELSNVLMDIHRQSAVAAIERQGIRDDIAELKLELKLLSTSFEEMRSTANRWKGGFLVVASLGGFAGWIVSSYESLVGLMKRF